MIAEVEDYVAKRIEILDDDGRHQVAFADGHGKNREPDRTKGAVATFTATEQRELRRLCVDARYRGRGWAHSWIDAVRNGWLCVIEQRVPQTADELTMRRLLRMIPDDPLLHAHPVHDDRLTWYENGLLPYARPKFDTNTRKAAFRQLVEFFDVVFARINVTGTGVKDVRRLAHLEAERVWAFVVDGNDNGLASSDTRAGVGRRESKAGLSKRHFPTT